MQNLYILKLIFLIVILTCIAKSDFGTGAVTDTESNLNQIMKPIKTSIYK